MFRTITVIDKSNFTPQLTTSNDDECSTDVIKADVPLLIRLLEYVREESVTDEQIHKMAERLIEHSEDKIATMDAYDYILNGCYPEEPVFTEKAMLFRMDSRTLWSRFTWSPLNYSIALNNGVEGLTEIEQRIYRLATRVGESTKPYYGEEVGNNISNGLSEFGRIAVQVMTDLKNGIPLDGTKERWDIIVDELSTYISSINPEYWPRDVVKSYFDTLVQLWIDSINTRNNKDFAAYEKIADSIEVLMISGDSEVTSFADVFSSGIISQFPDEFKFKLIC